MIFTETFIYTEVILPSWELYFWLFLLGVYLDYVPAGAPEAPPTPGRCPRRPRQLSANFLALPSRHLLAVGLVPRGEDAQLC